MLTHMTVTQLIRQLQKLKEKHGNARIGVDRQSLWHGNGTFQICDIACAKFVLVNEVDDDGFLKCNAKGHEKIRPTIVLSGEAGDGQA